MGDFAMNNPNNIIIIQGLKQCIVSFALASNYLVTISDHVSSSPSGTLKGLVTAFATQLPKDYKKTVILSSHMGKLRP